MSLLHRYCGGNFSSPPTCETELGERRIAACNIQTAFVTDSAGNLSKFPKYKWSERRNALFECIEKDKPDILALYEFNLVQGQDIRARFSKEYDFVAYSSELGKSFDAVAALMKETKDNIIYGEFVGFLIRRQQFTLVLCSTEAHSLPDGARHKRILVEVQVVDTSTSEQFVLFSSHFDHLSVQSRKESGDLELALIKERIKNGQHCISFGDRNWFPDESGEEHYQAYVSSGLVRDVRDQSEGGHFGPMGTFPGHLGLPEKFAPKMDTENGRTIIQANTLDVIFCSPHIHVLHSYAYYGAFCRKTGKFVENEEVKEQDLLEKNFVSDHYYVGATIRVQE
jgi:endonuclease/exonuclease/phosphatase family metal-dependent hydrolase